MARKSRSKTTMTMTETDLVVAAAGLPEQVRVQIREQLLTRQVRDYATFTDVTQFILAHVISGDIPVDVAEVAKAYLELIFTSVAAIEVTRRLEKKGKQPQQISEVLDLAEREARRFMPAFEYTDGEGNEITFDMRHRRG